MKIKKDKYWVVIPAAGIGARMQSDRPKQYLSLQGKPILAHAVDTLSSMSEVEKVVVVLNAQDHWWPTLTLMHPEKVCTAIGGRERVHSVLLGLACLKEYAVDDDWVLVHDAARPCITVEQVRLLIEEVGNHLVGGLLGVPVADTLKSVNQKGGVLKTVPREGVWRAQTPQLFRYRLLKESIESALAAGVVVTDESSAVESFGQVPKMVLGDSSNLKVTFQSDIFLAGQCLVTTIPR